MVLGQSIRSTSSMDVLLQLNSAAYILTVGNVSKVYSRLFQTVIRSFETKYFMTAQCSIYDKKQINLLNHSVRLFEIIVRKYFAGGLKNTISGKI